MLIITIIFITACSKLILCDGNYSIRIGRAACTPSVRILCDCPYCKYRVDFVENKFIAIIEKCKLNEVYINWRFRYYGKENESQFLEENRLTDFDNNHIYIMKPGTVKTGYFGFVHVDVKAKTGGATANAKTEVWLFPKQYYVEMTTGTRVILPPGSTCIVEVEKTAPGFAVNWMETLCSIRSDQQGCEEWRTEGGGSSGEGCPKIPNYNMGKNQMKKEMPPVNICLNQIVYKIAPDTYLPMPYTQYSIHIDPNSKDILSFLRCIKNCGFSSTNHPVNPYKETQAEVVCLKNCDQISKSAKFRVRRDDNVEISTWRASGRKLFIFKNKNYWNKRYKVTYQDGELILAEGWITASPKYPALVCRVAPSSGIPIFTDFEIKCRHGGNSHHYMLRKYTFYQLKGRNKAIIGTEYVPCIRTTLQSDVETVSLKLDAYDMQGVTCGSNPFSVRLRREPMTKKVLDTGLKKMDALNAAGDHPYALNVGAAIASGLKQSQLSNKQKKQAKVQVIKRIANTIGKVKLDEMRVIESALPTFYPVDESQKEDLMKICETLTIKLPGGIERIGEREKQLATSKALMKCGSELYKLANAKSALSSKSESEKKKAAGDSSLEEDYPDYDSEYGASLSPDELRAMKIIKGAGVAGGHDLPLEGEIRSEGNDKEAPSYLVTRYIPQKIAGKTFSVLEVNVTLPPDLSKFDQSIVLSLIRYPAKDDESSPLVEVGFYRYKNVVNPIRGFTFNLKMPIKEFKEERKVFKCTVPKKQAELHHKMNCHRVKLRDSGLFVRFRDIHKGAKMQVMFSFNRRPEYAEFATKAYIIDGDIQEKYSYSFVSSSSHKFFYACVLPYKGKSKNIFGTASNDTYELSILFIQCNSLSIDNVWGVSGCQSSLKIEESTWIECKCTHTTLFIGRAKATTSDMNKLEERNFKLKYFINWVIFGHVAAVLFSYCILLVFILFRRPTSQGNDRLIFLSDNNKNDRYAYILIVESGPMAFSGTTSNVCIRLFGKRGSSTPHVLNYPDPDNKLLQRHGLDWMIITTMKHLGPLKHIHLWFDSIGCRPQWYCESITVLDLQTRREQYFNVRQWFSMGTKNPVSSLRILPTTKSKTNKNIVLQLKKYVRIYTGPEHTWNIIKSTHDFELTYPQRLTIILSLIFTVYLMCFVILSQPELKLSDEIGYGRFKFGVVILYTPILAALAAALINFPVVFFFRNSDHSLDGNSVCKEEKYFGSKITVVVWIFLLIWIFLATSYLVLFGFWITWNTSLYWIISTIIAILLLIFILENIYIALYNVLSVICGKVAKKYYFYARIIKEIESQRKFLYGLFGEYLLRPYFTLHYKILRGTEYKITRIREILRVQARVQLFDLLIFLIYIIVMYYLSLCHTLELGHVANRFIENLFLICKGTANEDKYCEERLYTIKNVYDYINQTVLPQTFPLFGYGEYNINNPGLESDACNKLLGVVRLRQQRREQICTPPRYLEKLGWHCSNESKVFDDWPKRPNALTGQSVGKLSTYSGDGYIVNFGRTLKNARFVLKRLLNLNWIDSNTKVLFIEFWTYNANYNFFNMVKIIIERDGSGRYLLSFSIYTSRFVFIGFTFYFNYIMVFLLMIFVFVITYRCVARWISEKKGFLLVFWNVFDLTLAVLDIVFLVLYFYRMMIIDSLMLDLARSDHNEFVDFQLLEFIARTGMVLSAFILSMATLRLWSYLHFGIITFKVAERALMNSLKDLMYMLLNQTVIFIGFAILLYSCFGSNFQVFSNFLQSITSVIVVSLNKIEEQHLHYVDFRFMRVWPYFIFAVLFLISIIINTLYSTIIMNAWTESKGYYSNKKMEYSIQDYVIQETRFLIEKIKRHSANVRLRGGGEVTFEDNDFVTSKDRSIRFAGIHSLSKLQLQYMLLVAQAVVTKHNNLVNHREMSKKDFELVAKLVIYLYELKKTEAYRDKWWMMNDEIFFCTKDLITHEPLMVDNFRIIQMEVIVKQMLKQEILPIDGIAFQSDNVAERMARMKNRLEAVREMINRIELTKVFTE